LLSKLQNRETLEELLRGVTEAREQLSISEVTAGKPKLILKIAPDLDESQLAEIAAVIRNSSIDGVIVSNTTIRRPDNLRSRE
jgi:dihydroorotate dehydrogenase